MRYVYQLATPPTSPLQRYWLIIANGTTRIGVCGQCLETFDFIKVIWCASCGAYLHDQMACRRMGVCLDCCNNGEL